MTCNDSVYILGLYVERQPFHGIPLFSTRGLYTGFRYWLTRQAGTRKVLVSILRCRMCHLPLRVGTQLGFDGAYENEGEALAGSSTLAGLAAPGPGQWHQCTRRSLRMPGPSWHGLRPGRVRRRAPGGSGGAVEPRTQPSRRLSSRRLMGYFIERSRRWAYEVGGNVMTLSMYSDYMSKGNCYTEYRFSRPEVFTVPNLHVGSTCML